VLAGVAAGLLLLLGGALLIRILSLNSQIAGVRPQANKSELLAKQIAEKQKELEPYEDWQASDFNWLRELALLARKLPNPDEMILTQLTLTANERAGRAVRDARKKTAKNAKAKVDLAKQEGGTVSFSGLAVSDAKVRETIRGIEPGRTVQVPTTHAEPNNPLFKASFQGVVKLPPREVDKEPVVTRPAQAEATEEDKPQVPSPGIR
jgi:Tfp pilus assembly protein PilN